MGFYGLGERVSTFRLAQGSYTMFARDQGDPYDDGDGKANEVYGVHPFYMALANSGSATGGLFFNSNAMEAHLGASSIAMETIGGVIDYYIFVGPTPTAVVQ
jgi:alpha-glucosidase (family GH31 glycosyl hydrolase)